MTHTGRFTKFGDVMPLIQSPDDMFVVMDSGDELALTFPAKPVAPGMERTYVIHTDGYHQTISGSVDPMPFQGMSNYPYAATEHYPDDQAHLDYLATWNTRVMGAGLEGAFLALDAGAIRRRRRPDRGWSTRRRG